MAGPERSPSWGKWIILALVLGVVVLLILPAFKVRHGDGPSSRSRLNLYEIGLAMHDYHDAHGHFPPAAATSPAGWGRRASRCLGRSRPTWLTPRTGHSRRWAACSDSRGSTRCSRTVGRIFLAAGSTRRPSAASSPGTGERTWICPSWA